MTVTFTKRYERNNSLRILLIFAISMMIILSLIEILLTITGRKVFLHSVMGVFYFGSAALFAFAYRWYRMKPYLTITQNGIAICLSIAKPCQFIERAAILGFESMRKNRLKLLLEDDQVAIIYVSQIRKEEREHLISYIQDYIKKTGDGH